MNTSPSHYDGRLGVFCGGGRRWEIERNGRCEGAQPLRVIEVGEEASLEWSVVDGGGTSVRFAGGGGAVAESVEENWENDEEGETVEEEEEEEEEKPVLVL